MTFSTDSQRPFNLAWHVSLPAGLADRLCSGAGLMNGTCLIALGALWQFVNPYPCGSGKKYKLSQQAI
jgi:hypothetical protein